MINIYVGNLSYQASEQELRDLFAAYGSIGNVTIIKDRDTGRSKGFGFVEMDDNSAGLRAIDALNGKDLGGRPLKINEARPREERPRRDRFGGGRGFGGGCNNW